MQVERRQIHRLRLGERMDEFEGSETGGRGQAGLTARHLPVRAKALNDDHVLYDPAACRVGRTLREQEIWARDGLIANLPCCSDNAVHPDLDLQCRKPCEPQDTASLSNVEGLDVLSSCCKLRSSQAEQETGRGSLEGRDHLLGR